MLLGAGVFAKRKTPAPRYELLLVRPVHLDRVDQLGRAARTGEADGDLVLLAALGCVERRDGSLWAKKARTWLPLRRALSAATGAAAGSVPTSSKESRSIWPSPSPRMNAVTVPWL
jgi:hypothetical protein